MKYIFTSALCLMMINFCHAQKLWTEEDRKFLLDRLTSSRDSIILETKNLSEAQWNFKESPDRWSINEVVEHIAIWELLMTRDVSGTYWGGLQPEKAKNTKPDSTYLNFILEEKPHYSLEYTKPFSFTIPMGINPGPNNVKWLLKMRNESIDFVKTTNDDLRLLFHYDSSVHQRYITIFGHSERHLRQIRKIKANANYPKK